MKNKDMNLEILQNGKNVSLTLLVFCGFFTILKPHIITFVLTTFFFISYLISKYKLDKIEQNTKK